jgi:hypothetical protein
VLNAGILANPVDQCTNAPPAHGGDGSEHFGKEIFVDIENTDGLSADPIAPIALHARVRQQAAGLTSAAHENSGWSLVATTDLNLASQNEGHVVDGLSLAKDQHVPLGYTLDAVHCEPGVLFVG